MVWRLHAVTLIRNVLLSSPGKHVQVQGVEYRLPAVVSRRDQRVARTLRDDVEELVGFVGVVENQQPAAVRLAGAERLENRRRYPRSRSPAPPQA